MGTADLVPGVSGGTVALAAGIYARLIAAIRGASEVLVILAKGRLAEAARSFRGLDWSLLLPLLAGIAAAILSLASLVEHHLESSPVQIGGLFMGLVLGSVAVALRMLRRINVEAVVLMGVFAVVMFLALGLVPETHSTGEARDVGLLAYGASGALAICAMILPGISGSFMLVAVGMYVNVLGAVNSRNLLPIAVFLVGCVVGLALFSRLLFWLIRNHHDRVVAVMIGLMLGSVRILWPWPGGPLTSELGAPTGNVIGPMGLGILGLVAVLAVARIAGVAEEATL